MGSPHFRQGMRLPSLKAVAFTVVDGVSTFVDFPTLFPSGVTFKMVGQGLTITGPATGSSSGVLVYDWAVADLAVAGTYAAVFLGTDVTGRPATFPTGENLEIIVVPAL